MNTQMNERPINLREAMFNTALDVVIPILSTDTCARLLAIIHSCTHEGFTYSERCQTEIKYVQKRFRIDGGETPDADFAALLRKYVGEIEAYGKEHKAVIPWARTFAKDRYGIDLFW